ncbi:MAG: sigma-70 family RNA polymerase sigma factor [Actinophytocola sp.]|nr:sigma-70 family RNA polymerase sigma factor [Actinophytocola sp.]
MPRTRQELERAAAGAEAWLNSLDPDTTPAEDASDLREIGLALGELVSRQCRLEEAVVAARNNGRSWSEIGLVLGVSKQAARERYARLINC